MKSDRPIATIEIRSRGFRSGSVLFRLNPLSTQAYRSVHWSTFAKAVGKPFHLKKSFLVRCFRTEDRRAVAEHQLDKGSGESFFVQEYQHRSLTLSTTKSFECRNHGHQRQGLQGRAVDERDAGFQAAELMALRKRNDHGSQLDPTGPLHPGTHGRVVACHADKKRVGRLRFEVRRRTGSPDIQRCFQRFGIDRTGGLFFIVKSDAPLQNLFNITQGIPNAATNPDGGYPASFGVEIHRGSGHPEKVGNFAGGQKVDRVLTHLERQTWQLSGAPPFEPFIAGIRGLCGCLKRQRFSKVRKRLHNFSNLLDFEFSIKIGILPLRVGF